MGCLESMKHEIILRDASFRECREFILAHFPEHIEVLPGYKIFEKNLIGVPPLYIAIDGGDVIIPYTKPCYGTFLIRVPDAGMVEELRKKNPR
jgi:hypothetical protein